jgi:alanyl-tRNA synthetase
MTTKELKEKYLKFFEEKGHKIIPGASLIPEHDPTVLFTTAGMHPLVPYLLGEKHPAGKRLADVQKCIRTSDIDDVGDDVHLTFFEMLGNWGLGSYWKKEAIEMSWEFLTDKKWLGLDKKKISVSVFAGDPLTGSGQIPRDLESAEIWKSLGVKEIKFLGREENFWGPAGQTGPCGPCTEMFYDGVEIWNDVFMEFNKTADGKYEQLKQKNVDTGMGVERTVAVLNGKKSVFDVEPLKSIVEAVKKLSSYVKVSEDRAERIIADHLRAATFILGDEKGIVPSNVEQGYVLRRLIRRAIRYGKKIGIEKPFTHEIGKLVIELMSDEYPELENNKDFIIEQLVQEEERFDKTLEKGLKEFEKGTDPFILFTTYGFPIEMTEELAKEKGIKIDRKKFEEEFKKHQELSRTATAGKFKSGLADHSEEVTKLHTATHLLLAALRQVLGDHVVQKGSNITAERLRLDFSHLEKMTPEQLKKVEDIVNEQIKKDLPVSCCEVSLEEAKKMGAMGVFESKYGDKVKVYTVGKPKRPFSCEICGGPHITHTGELRHFKILKEESSSAGVRRIRAILE